MFKNKISSPEFSFPWKIPAGGQTSPGRRRLNFLGIIILAFLIPVFCPAKGKAEGLSGGVLGSLVLINQGADQITALGAKTAMDALLKERECINSCSDYDKIALRVFGALSGGRSRYGTGSPAAMSSLSLLTGLSLSRWLAVSDLFPGHLSLGAFFEYGSGSYDNYSSFGSGDISRQGGGVLMRLDMLYYPPSIFYIEASGRMGRVHNDSSSPDWRNASNQSVS
jgi:hypothetical protein